MNNSIVKTDNKNNNQVFNQSSFKYITGMRNVKFVIKMGESHLIAEAVNYAMVTQGKTWTSLMKNIDEVTRLHFDLPDNEKYNLELEIAPEVTLSLVKKNAKAKGC